MEGQISGLTKSYAEIVDSDAVAVNEVAIGEKQVTVQEVGQETDEEVYNIVGSAGGRCLCRKDF